MLSSRFRVAEYLVKEQNIHDVKCSWKFLDPQSMEVVEEPNNTPVLFSKKTHFP